MMEKLDALASRLANQQTLQGLRRGLLYLMPLILIGSFILALTNLPIPIYQSFLEHTLGDGWRDISLSIYHGTLQILSMTALITVSYALAGKENLVISGEVNPIVIVITTFASYITFSNDSKLIPNAAEAGTACISGALIISVLACKMFCFFYNCRDRIRSSNLIDYQGSSRIRSSFRAVIPSLLTILFFSVARHWFDVIQIMLQRIIHEAWFSEYNYFSALMIILLTHVLWFLGIHGGNFMNNTMSGAGTEVSETAISAIFTKEFFDIYVYLGGAGVTLGLLVALLLAGERGGERRLARISILPGIFNINEIIIFGLPILFNPYYLIPFLMSPVILGITSWIAVYIGWIPPATHAVEWTTPIFLSGYLGSGSMAGVVLQAANLILAVLIYMPFVRLQARQHHRSRMTAFRNLASEVQYIQAGQQRSFLNRHDETGYLARALAAEIRDGLLHHAPSFHLEYQPKVNYKGEVMGAEALLRWMHPVYGTVSPLVILSLCDEAHLTHQLGQWIIHQACCDWKYWHDQGYEQVSLSMNLSPQQLKEDDSLVEVVESCIRRFEVDPHCIELELTENATIDLSEATLNKLKQIKEMGLSISIDDFGAGHSSLLYLCDLYANVVKLDASLIRTITSDRYRRQIVKSLISLCSQLKVKLIVEGVETQEQMELLHEFGCEYYQGYYFSRSLDSDSFMEYLQQHGWVRDREDTQAGRLTSS